LNTECLKCPSEGFVKVPNATPTTCEVCPTNCITCTGDTGATKVCTYCKKGYFIKDGSATGECVLCNGERDFKHVNNCKVDCVTDTRCRECGSTAKCSKCTAQYYVSLPDAITCVACTGDGSFKKGNYCITTCTSNCKVCATESTCSVCQAEYFADSTGACTACGVSSNCLKCKDTSSCYICKSGYTLRSDGTCVTGSPCPADEGLVKSIGNRIILFKV
jgi:proprotein convertase subtilisin/kexin type 5